jgi:hypothetical protein
MKELTVEGFLQERAGAAGGVCEKWGIHGWPDRMVLLPDRRIGFLELKRPGKEPTPLQHSRIRALSGLGFLADWTDDLQGVADFMRRLRVH